MSAAKPVRYRKLGGWDVKRTVKSPRNLYRVSISTSIDGWDEFILARNREELDQILVALYPGDWPKGYEPEIVQLNVYMDSIHTSL